MLKRLFLFVLCTSVILAGADAFAISTIWDFSGADLTASSGYDELVYRDTATEGNTFFYQTNGGSIPHIGGQVADYMNFPKSDVYGGYNIDRPFVSPSMISYTLLFDVLYTQTTFDTENYAGLFNTNPANSNDAELFVDMRDVDDDGVAVQGRLFADRDSDNEKVITNIGIIQPNTWHRIAFAYDENHATEDVRVFVDGVKVGASDTEFGGSSFTVRDIIPVLTENSSETVDGYLSAMAFVNNAMTDADITTLGAPTSTGFTSIADPGDPPVDPGDIHAPHGGTNSYVTALAATNPLVHLPLNRDEGAVIGDPVENLGSFTGLAATWGLPGYDGTIPVSGATGPNSGWEAGGEDLGGFLPDNKCVELTGHLTAVPGSNSDMLNLGNPTELDLDTATWSFWLNTDDTASWRRLMITDPGYENAFYIVQNDAALYLVTASAAGGEITHNTAEVLDIALNDSEWHHLVAVRDGDDASGCKLYIDGEEVTLSTRTGSFGAGYSFRIGCQGTSSSAWTGLMDEIAIWDRALTPAEVTTLFEAAIVDVSNIPGDANCDGVVNDLDAEVLAQNWQTIGSATWSMGDFNDDGNVDDIDATILASNWQTTSSASVPEPGLLVVLAGALAALAVLRRRR